MNIEDAKLVSVLQSRSPVEGGTQHLTDNGTIPEGFADALKGQLELLSETKDQGELSAQFQSLVEFQQSGNLPGNAVPPGNQGEAQKLAGLSGKPLATVNEELDLKATLDALADSLKYTVRGVGEEPAAHPGQEKAANNPALDTGNEDVDLKASPDATLADFFASARKTGEEMATQENAKKLGGQDSESKTEDLDQVLAVTGALPSIPAHPGQEKIANNPALETGNEGVDLKVSP
jgi:hypothetical protein